MALYSGNAAQIGIATESVVNTPATPTLFLPFVDESLDIVQGRVESGAIIANRRVLDSGQWNGGISQVGGDIGFELSTQGLGRIFKHMFGSVSTSGAGPYTHVFTPGSLSGLSATYQVGVPGEGSVIPKTVSGGKVASWAMEFAANEVTNLGLSIVGQSLQMGTRTVTSGATTNADATVTSANFAATDADIGRSITGTNIPAGAKIVSINSATSVEISAAATGTGTGISLTVGFPLATASYAANEMLKFNHGTITLDGTVLAVVKSGSISGDNALNTDRAFVGDTDIAEPIEAGLREYGVSLTVQFEDTSHYDLMAANDEVALVLAFSRGGASVSFTTNIRIDQATAAVAGREVVEQTITAKCVGTTDAAAITATLVNSDSSAA